MSNKKHCEDCKKGLSPKAIRFYQRTGRSMRCGACKTKEYKRMQEAETARNKRMMALKG